MKTKALKTIKEYNMIKQGDMVTVGFSGGADSVALLYLMYELKEYNLKLQAVHLNHMLRGAESFRDENFASEFCKNLGIDFYVMRIDITKLSNETGLSIEETARDERYKLFNNFAKGGKIATAHTLSDNLETILINLTRGTGLDGLTGIPAVRDNIIRPIIDCSREEIEQYCKDNSLDYVTDSTNLETDYTRNKIRITVVPTLKEINSSVENNTMSMVKLLKQDSDFLEGLALEKQNQLFSEEKGYNIAGFLDLPEAISSRILKNLLVEQNLEFSFERINLMYEKIKSNESGMQLSRELYLNLYKDYFIIEELFEKTPYFSVECRLPDNFDCLETEVFDGKVLEFKKIECKEIENIAKTSPKRLKNLLDCDKIGKVVLLRQRESGDRICLAGRNGSKTLKKLFNEYKVPLEQREKLVVLESADKVCWVEGFGVSEESAVNEKTKNAIEIKII